MLIQEHNVATGEIIQREMTAAEKKQVDLDAMTAAQAIIVAKEAADKKAAIVAALADATGFTADELREALNA